MDTVSVMIPVGQHVVQYPEGIKVDEVKLRGMRNRPIALKRIPWPEWQTLDKTLRGLPSVYALNFKRREIAVWPAPLQSYELLVIPQDASQDPDSAVA